MNGNGGGLRHRHKQESDVIPGHGTPERNIVKKLKKLDAYAKVQDDFKIKTASGGTVSVIAWVLIVLLLVSETYQYMKVQTKEHMVVDTSLQEKLKIHMNITFHAINCNEVHLDAMDVAGDNQLGMEHSLTKQRISKNGKPIGKRFVDSVNTKKALEGLPEDYCGPCYGADALKIQQAMGHAPRLSEAGEPCCATCQDVVAAYGAMGWGVGTIRDNSEQCQREERSRQVIAVGSGEGCNLAGSMEVNKVAGNFHVAIGEGIVRNGRHIHQFDPALAHTFDITHTVHRLAFGPPNRNQPVRRTEGPLDGAHHEVTPEVGTGLLQYYVQIVPTVERRGDDWTGLTALAPLPSHRYSFTKRFQPLRSAAPGGVLPGVFVIYDLSPFTVEISRIAVPFTHFLTKICAIAGGVYTVAGIIDSLIHRSRAFSKGMLPS